MRPQYFVYALTEPSGKIFYIGKSKITRTRKPIWRLIEHLSKVRCGHVSHNYNKIRKLLREELEIGFEVLSWWVDEEDALLEEVRLIAEIGRENLTNGTDGGDGTSGYKPTEETKRKIAEAKKGRPLSKEHIKKVSLALKGRIFSEEHKRKISEANKGRKHTPEERAKMKGRKCSLASREKMSKAQRGRKHSVEARRKMSEAHKGKPWSKAKRAAYERRYMEAQTA